MNPIWITAVTAGLAMAGIAVTARPDETGEVPAVTLDDDGATVHLCRNETLRVDLEGNPSTGFTWEIAEVDRWVLADHGKPEFVPSDRLVGGGTLRFRFTAEEAGETDVRLVYHRPWEDDAPLQTFTVRVVSD